MAIFVWHLPSNAHLLLQFLTWLLISTYMGKIIYFTFQDFWIRCMDPPTSCTAWYITCLVYSSPNYGKLQWALSRVSSLWPHYSPDDWELWSYLWWAFPHGPSLKIYFTKSSQWWFQWWLAACIYGTCLFSNWDTCWWLPAGCSGSFHLFIKYWPTS